MPKFRKRPVMVEAARWFKVGDDPDVKEHPHSSGTAHGINTCALCGRRFADHGQIKTLEGVMDVCPGDWIITGVKGERYCCKDDIFRATYEPADEHGHILWEQEAPK